MSPNLAQAWLRMPAGERHDLNSTFTIGRAPDNTLPLPESEVSRRHAIIHPQGSGEYRLVDLGSANGTYVNGQRISQAVRLQNEDVIRIGKRELQFFHSSVPATTQTAYDTRAANVWLLVMDIIGSAQLAGSVPMDDLPRLTGGWFKSCRQVVEECGGSVVHYLDDGFITCWPHTPDGAIQVRQAVARLYQTQENATPPFRAVLHFGAAMLGYSASGSMTSVFGPDADFAFRLDRLASRLGHKLVLSEAAVSQMQAQNEVKASGEHLIEGFPGQHRLYTPAR